ncbi:diguanylate cyclase domain-containing protein [Psychromonas sp. GE-S-Ul-11]|uniref:diguanylate cyclase domain-containing protein n=1 Tax=unclassified Psychromonas TaxID=2614957 RepID=UPI00390C7510
MLRAKRFYFFDFIFFSIMMALIIAIFIVMSDDESQRQQRKLVERTVYNSFMSTLAQTKSNATLLFELQYGNQAIAMLLDQANQAKESPEKLQEVTEQLYQSLQPQFKISRKKFPFQQIYLTNSQLLLHLDQQGASDVQLANNKIGLEKVIKKHKPFSGLSLKNGRYVYRYFFPVFNASNEFIAVVELSLPLAKIQNSLADGSEVTSQYMWAKRPLLAVTRKNNIYRNTPLSKSFLISLNRGNEDTDKATLSDEDLTELKSKLTAEQSAKLLQLKRFSFNTKINGRDGVVMFMPISNIYGYHVGGLVTFMPTMKLYISSAEFNVITFILALLLVVIFLYALKKSAHLYQIKVSFQRFLDAMPFPIYLKNNNNQYCGANKAFCEFFALSKRKLFNRDASYDHDFEAFKVPMSDVEEAGGYLEVESEQVKGDEDLTYKMYCFSMAEQGMPKQGFVGYINDVSNYKSLNKKLKSSLFDQSQFMDILPFGVRIFNLEGHVTYVNKALRMINGGVTNEFLSSDCEAVFSCMECHTSVCALHKSRILKAPQRIETIKHNDQGEAFTYEVSYHPYYTVDKKIQGVVELTNDITINKSLLDKNHELVLSDELTGVLNYRGLINAGENYFRLAARAKKPFFVLYLNIIGLNKISAEHGTAASEKLITCFAELLKDTFRETDIIARIGNDEFVVLMNDSEYEVIDSGKFARLDEAIKRFNVEADLAYRLVCDTGIVEYKSAIHDDLSALIKEAEQVVYEQGIRRGLGN